MTATTPPPTGSPAQTATATLESEVLQAADFSQIRYSQSWEDPSSLERGLQVGPGDSVLSIAASGDNSFALLLLDPDRVVSVDMSPAQCALVELKRAAIIELGHAELLEFLGVRSSSARGALYQRVRASLPEDARAWWDAQPELIARGVIHVGRLEEFFATFRRWILPLVQPRRTLFDVFEPRDWAAREEFYDRRWNNRRWRAVMRMFFSELVIGRLGRDPAFFKHVDLPSVGGHYAERLRHAMVEQPVSSNWFIQYILFGNYLDPDGAHPYLRAENLPLLKARIDRLEIHCAPLEHFLERQPPGSFTAFNLSDIFEWMSDDLYEQMLLALVRTSAPGGRLAYWNNLVLRSRPRSLESVLEPDRELARAVHHDDLAFLYRDFRIERIISMPDDTGGHT